MIIAATYDNGSVFQHFGHSEYFKVYEIEDGKVRDSRVIGSDGQGHGALAGLLATKQVGALICGGIGPGAVRALESFGIKVYAGVSGSADAAVEALLAGTLDYSEQANCDHHAHEDHGESCGDHGCGSHGDHGCGSHGCH
jgi:predicted Fe-Mo cluster-binding NifX family protein